jgi:hypothetical protein
VAEARLLRSASDFRVRQDQVASARAIRTSTRDRGWAGPALAALILLAGGTANRALLARANAALGVVLQPKRPMASLPLDLGQWHGTDVPLDRNELRVTWFDDDFINRSYIHTESGVRVGAFVGYVGRPRAQFGHRPDICYAAHGWEQYAEETITIAAGAGLAIPCVVYEFRQPNGLARPMLVLGTYLINGRYFEKRDQLRRWQARTPGWLGERPAYLTRIQLASPIGGDRQATLASLVDLAGRLAGPVTEIMPYWEQQ